MTRHHMVGLHRPNWGYPAFFARQRNLCAVFPEHWVWLCGCQGVKQHCYTPYRVLPTVTAWIKLKLPRSLLKNGPLPLADIFFFSCYRIIWCHSVAFWRGWCGILLYAPQRIYWKWWAPIGSRQKCQGIILATNIQFAVWVRMPAFSKSAVRALPHPDTAPIADSRL